jgi:hypothetical protein
MQRVKCNWDIVKVFKKRIKSVDRILFEKIIFLFDEYFKFKKMKCPEFFERQGISTSDHVAR